MSDGTEFLRFLDPATFAERRRVRVTGVGQPVKNLNELEYVKGEVFANVWLTDFIARIDPASGKVTGTSTCAACCRRAMRAGRRAQRHRLRRRRRPPVRHRQTLAATVRNQTGRQEVLTRDQLRREATTSAAAA